MLLPQLKRYGLDESSGALELKISRRGAPPLGGGCIVFKCPTLRCLKPQRITDPGKIKRIRGIAYATRISPLMASRGEEFKKKICSIAVIFRWK